LEGQAGDTICLLKRLPGHINEESHGSLTTVRLDEKPEYRALSYTWGDATDPEVYSWLGEDPSRKELTLAEQVILAERPDLMKFTSFEVLPDTFIAVWETIWNLVHHQPY
jgi:hypothetical protein